MRKLSVLGLPSDDRACGKYRVEWPLAALQDAKLADTYVPPIKHGDRFCQDKRGGR